MLGVTLRCFFLSLMAMMAVGSVTGCATGSAAQRGVAQQKGGNANTRLMIAEMALQRGDYPTAAEEYLEASRRSSSDTLAEQATRVSFDHRQDRLTLESARRWLELAPDSAEPRRFLAVVSLRLYDVDEAVRQFKSVIGTYETPAAAFLDLSATLSTEDNPYAVLAVLRGLADSHSRTPEAHYAVGAAALRAYNYSLAVDSARRALELNAKFADAERLLARALVVSGHAAEGLKVARARAEAETSSSEGKAEEAIQDDLEVALLLAAFGDTKAARLELEKLLSAPETRADSLRTLASLDLSEGRLDEAQRHFTELLTTGRYVSLAFYSLGAVYERQRDAAKAVRYYTRVTSGQYASDAHLRAARLMVNNGARDQANGLLDTFVNEHPDAYVAIVIGRARMFADEGDTSAGLDLLDEASRRYPEMLDLRYARSLLLERGNRINESVAELRTILTERPEDPLAMNALGYMLAEHKRNLPEADSLIRAALERSPDNPAVQDTTGWVLYRLGQGEQALKWLQRAYAVEKDAEIAAHIGEVYWSLGERGKAREIWQAALAAEPTHRYLLRTLRRYPE